MCLVLPGKCGMGVFEPLNQEGAARVVECNDTFLEMLGGKSRGEVVGNDPARWLAEEYAGLEHRKAVAGIGLGEMAGGVFRWSHLPEGKEIVFVATRVSVGGEDLFISQYQWKSFVEHGSPRKDDLADDSV